MAMHASDGLTRVPRIDKVRSAVEQMIGSARHASDVIERIRALSKRRAFESVRLDINQVIDDVVALIRRESTFIVYLCGSTSGSLPPVDGDRIQLQQVITKSSNERHPGHECGDRPRSRTADTIARARVRSDTRCGGGFRHRNRARTFRRLFNAFFTTKPDGMAWDYQSAVRSSKPTVANCGPQQRTPRRHVSVHRAAERRHCVVSLRRRAL